MNERVSILVVEDDPIDVRFIRQALTAVDKSIDVNVARDGREAIQLLNEKTTPDLIVSDLNMPGMNGHDLLEAIKNHVDWKKIPTIILSTSSNQRDINECYSMHANAYIVKPDTVAAYGQIAKQLKRVR